MTTLSPLSGEPAERPVFVFTLHRSGGTFLTRLLNCHPGLVVWGEHGGFLNRVAEAQLLLDLHQHHLAPRSDAELRDYIAFDEPSQIAFDPWVSPVVPSLIERILRDALKAAFTRGLDSDQRWGFKEIRYHSPLVARFLSKLFPAGQFILLDRDPIEVCISSMLVPWGTDGLCARRAHENEAIFRAAVSDCLYAVLAVRRNMAGISAVVPGSVASVEYAALSREPRQNVRRVFDFLHLEITKEVEGKLHRVLKAKSGVTPTTEIGLLSPVRIRAAAQQLMPQLVKEINESGIDVARLRGLGGTGQWCHLVGDHGAVGSPVSSIF